MLIQAGYAENILLSHDAGRLRFYLGQGRFAEDKIPANFFGCAGVAEIERLQDVLLHARHNGYHPV